MMVCPRCGVKSNAENRLVTDSCGHLKCRKCFLNDVIQCLECCIKPASSSETNEEKVEFGKQKDLGGKTTVSKHVQQVRLPDGASQFHCTICNKKFRSRSQQYYHLGCSNEAAKKFKCDQCERHFSSRSHFNYHLETHVGNQYQCSACEKTFSNRTVFQKHQKIHQHPPTSCSECERVFRCKASLVAHMEQHRNNLRFQCTLCERKYAVKSTLQQHMLKHFAKKHQCSECGKRFQRNSTLKLHLKRHAKSNSFICATCFRSFRDEGSLLRHTKLHKVAVKYKCVHCDITTIRKDNMLRHVRNMHLGQEFDNCVEVIESEHDSGDTALVTVPFEVLPSRNYDVNLPKTVQNSTVIKCIGNVEPVKIPKNPEANIIPLTSCPLESAAISKDSLTAESKNLKKKKYDPIEMYRRILISGDEELSTQNDIEPETLTTDNFTQEDERKLTEPTRSSQNTSNQMHWRKKYTYEYQVPSIKFNSLSEYSANECANIDET